MRSQVKKSTVRDKIKLAHNFLTKLRFLADEVRAANFSFSCRSVALFHRLTWVVPLAIASTQRSRRLHMDDKQWQAHCLCTSSFQRHPVFQHWRGERKGLWQSQNSVSEGESWPQIICYVWGSFAFIFSYVAAFPTLNDFFPPSDPWKERFRAGWVDSPVQDRGLPVAGPE